MHAVALSLVFTLFTCSLSAQTVWYVRQGATGNNNGQDWNNAFIKLQDALDTAVFGDSIWVAQGTYVPTEDTIRTISFSLKTGLKLFGGFDGTESFLTERDWLSNPTILSGDIGAIGDSTDNSYTVLYLEHADENTLVDGVIIRDGQADDPTINFGERGGSGAGLYIQGADDAAYPSIRNCIFEHNYAYVHGGGVYVNAGTNGSIAPDFQNCIFKYNHARRDGGGLYWNGGSMLERKVDLYHCRFEHNHAERTGGGLLWRDGEGVDTFQVVGCSFLENSALSRGGGMAFQAGREGGSTFIIDTCSVKGNISPDGAGISMRFKNLFDKTVYVRLANCEIIENVGLTFRSELYWNDVIETSMIVENCRFEKNNADGGVFDSNSDLHHITVRKCYFINNLISGYTIRADGFINTTIEDCVFKNNRGMGSGYFFCNLTFKHKLTNCLFYNNSGMHYEKFQIDCNIDSYVVVNNLSMIGNRGGVHSGVCNGNILYQNCIFHSEISPDSILQPFDRVKLSHCFFDVLDCTPSFYFACAGGMIIGGDPMFRDTSAGDFRLQPCSPLVDAGKNISIDTFPFDIAGNPRIINGTVDIGAYEALPPSLAATPIVTPTCAATGSVSFPVQDACAPLNYAWSATDGGSGQGRSFLAAGTYTFTLTDARGASFTTSITIPMGQPPLLNPVSYPVICSDTLGGSATVSISSLTGPHVFEWDGGSQDSVLSALAVGTYTVTVTDVQGCTIVGQVQVDKIGGLDIDIALGAISCNGADNGSLTVLPENGKAPFAWHWESGTDTSALASLGPGDYRGTLTDALGCQISWVLPLGEPDSLLLMGTVTEASNATSADGSILLTGIGGTAPYQFLWESGASGLSVDSLLPGLYTVTLTDAHDCSLSQTFQVGFTIATNEAGKPISATGIRPNPASDYLTVYLEPNTRAMPLHLMLADASGRLVLKRSLGAGLQKYELDVSSLPAGYYWVEVIYADDSSAKYKVIVF